MICIEGSFDPITDSDLRKIKVFFHKSHCHDLFIIPSGGKAAACFEDRLNMLKRALAPYRHLHALSGSVDQPIHFQTDDQMEQKAREGEYRLIAKGARGFVYEKGIYLEETVEHKCRPHRAIHSRGVAETAKKIAEAHHLDAWRAYEMGMLHDITKAFSDEENGRIIASLKPEWKNLSPKVWHSFTAGVFMKRDMGWHDQEIIHAIEHHTLGDGHTDFDRILYIADKIEPNRGYNTDREMKLACEDLKAASALILKESEEYRAETGK